MEDCNIDFVEEEEEEKTNIYQNSFDKLYKLQKLIKKESSLKELCI